MSINTNTTATTRSSIIKEREALKLSASKGELFKAIQIVQPAISTRSTLPILGNILFEAGNGELRLSATDLEVGIRTKSKADVIQSGTITVPAKIVSDFLKTIDDDKEVKIEVLDGNKVEFRSGRDRLSVVGLPKEDYPVLPEFEDKKSILINKEILREIIKKTVFAVSADETRYVLNGIHLIIEGGKMTGVATDGRRLAYIQKAVGDDSLKVKVIVPTKAVQELLRLSSEVKGGGETLKASFTDNQASFSDGETVVLSRLIEGHFPNFEQVIPKTHEIQVKIDRSEFLASITRAAVGTLERGGAVKVSLAKGVLKAQASAQGRVEAESEMAINYEGANFEIAFNPVYVMDSLRALDQKEILLEFTSALNPGVIRPAIDDGYRYVMMPMKV